MKWASGEETMKAYLHLYDAAQHAKVQDSIHKQLHNSVNQQLPTLRRKRTDKPLDPRAPKTNLPQPVTVCSDPAYTYLIGLGGGNESN